MQTHIINLTQAKHGKASMHYLGVYLGDSIQPIYAAARILLKKGLAKGDDAITTLRDDTVCLTSKVSVAATRAVVENARRGPSTTRYRVYRGKAR